LQQNKAVASMVEGVGAEEAGWARFDPLLASPEHCGAAGALLHELRALAQHHHPAVVAHARALLTGSALPEHKLLVYYVTYTQGSCHAGLARMRKTSRCYAL
jgi:hypothetical protein